MEGHDFTQLGTGLERLGALLGRFPSREESWMLPILGDPSLRSDILGSGMSQNRAGLVEFFGQDAGRFASANLQQQAERAVAALETDPTGPAPWLELAAIVGDLPIYAELRERLCGIARELPLVALRSDNWTALRRALPILATTTSGEGSESPVRGFVDKLVDLLRTLPPTDDDSGRRGLLEQVVEAAYSVSMALDSEAHRRRVFFETLARLLWISPNLCDVMAPGILNLRRTLVSEARSEVAEVLFACRARASGAAFQ
jgi:hypothetical protein